MELETTEIRENQNHEVFDADNDKVVFGFWVYILSDCILFASLFATYAVLHGNTFGGPGPSILFNSSSALAETLILLLSSFTCGLGMLAARKNDKKNTLVFFGITFLLGVSFLIRELSEFSQLIASGNSFTRSGFLSSFFTLVGTHGLHISIGLLWMIVVMVKVLRQGLTPSVSRNLACLSLFWHFLDIVWVFIFSFVYLMGAVHL